jgi:hypothetical protein
MLAENRELFVTVPDGGSAVCNDLLMRWLTLDGFMRRLGTFTLIAFVGFFICAYPDETTFLIGSIIDAIAAIANAIATSIGTFFRTLFA